MSQFQNRPRPQPQDERSQTPLWFAIAGLLISVTSFSMKDLMIGDVVFWAGGVFTAISLVYYFFRPSHGIPTRRK